MGNFRLRAEESPEAETNRNRILELVDPTLPALRAASAEGEATADLLARALELRSKALYDLRRNAEAIETLRECIALRRAAVERHPGVPRRRNELLVNLNVLGASQRASGDPRGSIETLTEGVRMRETAIAREPQNHKLVAGLGIVLNNLALAQYDLHQDDEFLATTERALASYRAYSAVEPRDTFVQERLSMLTIARVQVLLDKGRVDEARADLEALPEVQAFQRLHMSRMWARLAAATGDPAHRERALVLLETAAGGPKAPEHLDSPDFESVRADPRFVAAEARLRP
jgi:tetratricopeptide (TPR) repeat protein